MTSFLGSIPSVAQLKSQLDEVRAQVYPRNETEKKVYEALSSKNWGASSTLLNDIASETYDYEKYNIIMNIVWQMIEGDGKTWKNMFKNGSERVIEAARDKMYRIRSLQDYNFYEGTIDRGSGVRELSKRIVELLNNNDAIRSEREKARAIRNKFIGISNDGGAGGFGGIGFGNSRGNDSYGRESSNYGRDNNGRDNFGRDNGSYGGRDTDRGKDPYRDSYSGGGGGRYDSGSNDSPYGRSEYSPKEKFGGGAYDSNRPPRYDDEPRVKDSFDDHVEEEEKIKVPSRSKAAAAPEKSTGGKLKVSIKKSSSSNAPAAAPAEVDLFGDSEFVSAPAAPAPAPVAAKPVDLFDPFVSAPTSTNSFDPFSSSTPVFTSAPPAPAPSAFPSSSPLDLFSAPSAAPTNSFPPMPSNNFMNPPMQQYGGFAAAPAPVMMQSQPQGMNMMSGMNSTPSYQPSYTSAPAVSAVRQLPPSAPQHTESDFGDFESHNAANSGGNGLKSWGDVGKLVDLSSITKNEDPKMKAPTGGQYNYGQNSFAGLDGFNKTPPASGGMRPAPMQSGMSQPVMASRPANGMMGQQGYGAPMQNPYPGQMAQPNYGGFPQQQYPGMQPQYQPQQPMGYGQPPQGYPQGFPYNQQGSSFR